MLVAADKVYTSLRQIAKKDYWQILYIQSKELNNINLFTNSNNHTYYQIYFLNQLAFYNSIHMDILMGDVPEIVLDNEIYEDSYHYYKGIKSKKEDKVIPKQKEEKETEVVVNKNQWVFTKTKGK